MRKPYIGITGFMSKDEVLSALDVVSPSSNRLLMVGVLMSSKTLAGQQNKWPGRYPKKEAIADIFVDDPRTLNLIHYNTDNPETLFSQLVEITTLAGPSLDGFQLNVAWPPISELENYRRSYPDKFLLLQVGGRAMARVDAYGCTAMDYFEQLVGSYLPTIDAILVDPSGGKGKPLDAAKGAEYLRAIRSYPALGIGIAGGLGPDTLNLLDPLIPEFPDLSIDAEGRLRDQNDALDVGVAREYIARALDLFATN